MAIAFQSLALAVILGFLGGSVLADEPNFEKSGPELAQLCDPGTVLTRDERVQLLSKLRISIAGREILSDFVRQYGSFENLLIQWDGVSYSQVVNSTVGRSPASGVFMSRAFGASTLGTGVCIHLTKKLPAIEHVADLAHELTHATRLSLRVLRGDVADVEEFVRARLTARGGEADAFAVECRVKHELLGRWDEFCSPYVEAAAPDSFDSKQVIKDFYNGRLSASLTGETYPIMLTRQYKAMLAKRSRIQYATNPYAGK